MGFAPGYVLDGDAGDGALVEEAVGLARDADVVVVFLGLPSAAESGDELRSYFNSDKDLKVACRMVDKAAERIAVFVAEQRSTP